MTKRVPAVRGFEDFYNMLDDFFNDPWVSGRSHHQDSFRVDVKETAEGYEVEAELPGVAKEEIALSLDEGRLVIRVEREERSNEEDKGYVHRERRYCSMQRGVFLKDAGQEGVKAKLVDGVLKIEIPKVPQVKRSRIIEIE